MNETAVRDRPKAAERPALTPEQVAAAFPGKYLSITSFKRDGSGVATPVWFVPEEGRLLVITDGNSHKARRIRRNPAVMVAPCTARGRLRREAVPARAEFLAKADMPRVEKLMARKYRIDRIFILPIYRVLTSLHRGRARAESVALAVTPR